MRVKINQIGQKYGSLQILELDKTKKRTYYKCLCVCGKIVSRTLDSLKMRKSRSCGCLRHKTGKKHINLIGRKYNRWTVISFSHKDSKRAYYYTCRCDCGTVKNIHNSKLTNGRSKSCGCYSREMASKRKGINNPNWKHDLDPAIREKRRPSASGVWSDKVKEKYNYTCQKCGLYSKICSISHHIISYSYNKDMALDINNGICLCANCHCSFHAIYGTQSNMDQMQEFIKTDLTNIHTQGITDVGCKNL